MLADWSLSNKNIFSEKNVLELGSGIGFTGITMAKYCDVKSLYLSDCHEDVLNTICQNIEINFPMEHKIEQDITTYLWNNHIIGIIIEYCIGKLSEAVHVLKFNIISYCYLFLVAAVV